MDIIIYISLTCFSMYYKMKILNELLLSYVLDMQSKCLLSMKGETKMKTNRISLQRISFYCVLIIGILICAYLMIAVKEPSMKFDNEAVYELEGDWKVEKNGAEQVVTLPADIEANAGDLVTFRKTIEAQEIYANTLMFYSSYQYVKVYIDDNLLLDYGNHDYSFFYIAPAPAWHSVRLPVNWSGKELRIEIIGEYDNVSVFLRNIYMGSKSALIFQVLENALLSLFINVPIMLIGFVLCIISFFFKDPVSIRKIRYVGFFALITSIWILLGSEITQVFSGKVLALNKISHILLEIIPIIIVYYLFSFPIFNKSRFMHLVYNLSIINFFFIEGLTWFGIINYMEAIVMIHVIIILEMVGISGVFVKEKINNKALSREYKNIFTALFMLGIFIITDIARFYIGITEGQFEKYTQIGLLCFIIIIGYMAISEEANEQENRIEKKMLERLVYIDVLTGLQNRTAFEKKMNFYRKNSTQNNLIILVADMNGLKEVNDNYGHEIGDQCIILIAKILLKYFQNKADCYRIGGDEFCVISENFVEGDFAGCAEEFANEVARLSHNLETTFSVASGYAMCGGADVDEAFCMADRNMYINKAKMKGED